MLSQYLHTHATSTKPRLRDKQHTIAHKAIAPRCDGAILQIACVVMAVAIGCSKLENPSGDLKKPVQESEHEHFPPHWPGSLFHASSRLDAMIADPDVASSNPLVSSSKEFADLIQWLPFLAADSDLGREPFARIDGWSTQFADRLKLDAQNKKPLREIVAENGIESMVRELSKISSEETKRLQALQQEYDSPQ